MKPEVTIYPRSEYETTVRDCPLLNSISVKTVAIEVIFPVKVAELVGAELFERSTGVSPYELMGMLMAIDHPQIQEIKDRIQKFRKGDRND